MSSCYFWVRLVQISVNPNAKLLIDTNIQVCKQIHRIFVYKAYGEYYITAFSKVGETAIQCILTPQIELLAYDVQCFRDNKKVISVSRYQKLFLHSLHFFATFFMQRCNFILGFPFHILLDNSNMSGFRFHNLNLSSLLFSYFLV